MDHNDHTVLVSIRGRLADKLLKTFNLLKIVLESHYLDVWTMICMCRSVAAPGAKSSPSRRIFVPKTVCLGIGLRLGPRLGLAPGLG